MSRNRQILVSVSVLAASAVSLSACGQRGPLYLPTEPAAAQRATLPQTLWPASTSTTALPNPAAPMATPRAAPASNPVQP